MNCKLYPLCQNPSVERLADAPEALLPLSAPERTLSPNPAPGQGVWQIANCFGPLILVLATMYAGLSVSYWVVLALAFPAAGLVVRIFAIQHDCGHNSFLISRKGNQAIGRVCSLVTFTPFASWLGQHAGHHGSWNNLD